MKRFVLMLMSAFAWVGMAMADSVTVADVTIPQGATGTFAVDFTITSGMSYRDFQLDVVSPEGLSYVSAQASDRVPLHGISDSPDYADYTARVIGLEMKYGTPIKETEGALLYVTLKADASLAVGSEHEVTLKEIHISDVDGKDYPFPDVTFKVTIRQNLVVLDETSTEAPAASDGAVDVLVKRSLKAGSWSTIVLPFAVDGEQLDDVFGEGVKLAAFTGVDTETNEDKDVVALTVNFEKATSLEANTPYLIQVAEDVAEIAVNGVEIAPEEEPVVERDELVTRIGRQTFYSYNSFVGTYVAGDVVPKSCLFLSGNQFFYSDGTVPILGFRGYFDFYDVLKDVKDLAAVKLNVSHDGVVTRLNDVATARQADTAVYDLGGRRLPAGTPAAKGLYIVGGKKVVK